MYERVFTEDQLGGGDGKRVYPVRILNGLSKKTLKRLRKLAKRRKRSPVNVGDTMPVVNRESPFAPSPLAMNGPGGWGSVAIGRNGNF